MLVLLGIAVVVAGFVARINPLLVILAAAIVTGMMAAVVPGVEPRALLQAGVDTLAAFGEAFNDNRYFHITWLVLPVIGLLERKGLQERARILVGKVRAATAGRLLISYLLVRQATAAGRALPDKTRFRIRGMSAATDNVGLFFGEDIFIAIGSIVLIVGFLEQSGLIVEPLQISVWAIPTAIAAFAVHGARLLLFDGAIRREIAAARSGSAADAEAGQ